MSGTHKGWLIYDEAGFKRNKWFAEHLLECAPEYGLELEVKVLPTEGLEYRELTGEKQNQILQKLLGEADLALQVNRKMSAHYEEGHWAIMRVIAPELSRALEAVGWRLLNNAMTAQIGNNKWLTYQNALKWEVPVLETHLLAQYQSQACPSPAHPDAEEVPAYPQVIKAVAGHGGSQVFWADNEQQREQMIRQLLGQGITPEEIICQQACSEPGKDMRVYVLGGKIYRAILRSSNRDFRSNFSLGGQIALAEPTREQRMVIDRLYEKLQFDFVGIDFIMHEGKWILNEIEDVVGTRMIYQLTDKDPVRDYLAYI
ncbi:MAG: ATP-grasp domain-containing protein, partial [Lachnospiraceae bacterium]|nr:ATP-grasp domain-containing protein [Lachnospiraceae bacterium]